MTLRSYYDYPEGSKFALKATNALFSEDSQNTGSLLLHAPETAAVNNHHKHEGLDPSIRSVSTVTAARANASSVFQLFSFLVV